MNKIGFQNFRKFEELHNIENNGITFLVGPNNSGKSTIGKAFWFVSSLNWLQINSVIYLDDEFEDEKVIDSNFKRLLNYNSSTKEMVFNFEVENFIVNFQLVPYDSDEVNAEIKSLSVKDIHHGLEFLFYPQSRDLLLTKKNTLKQNKSKNNSALEILEAEMKRVQSGLEELGSTNKGREYLTLIDQFNALKSKYDEFKKNSNKTFETEFEYEFNYGSHRNFFRIISEFINHCHAELSRKNNLLDVLSDMKKKEIPLLQTILQNKDQVVGSLQLFSNLCFRNKVYWITYFSLPQGKLFLKSDKENLFAQSIFELYDNKILPGEREYIFIQRWFKIFLIGDDFKINSIADEAFTLDIFKDGKWKPIADCGKGTLQITYLLFKLVNAICYSLIPGNNTTIIIEEPESNLHPAFQSKLSELFLEVHTEYKIKFIIETHSEYIIRQSQFFVKEQKFEKTSNINPFNIYYIDIEKGPYKMNYREDGKFIQEFGTGFFDESRKIVKKML
jgi:predicted ATPase